MNFVSCCSMSQLDLGVWSYVFSFSSRRGALLRRCLSPALRDVTGCCVASRRLEEASGWWEIREARGKNLACIVGATTEFEESDIVGLREEAMLNRTRNWLDSEACATLDVHKHDLRGLAVRSRFLASVAISANDGSRPGCALSVCRLPSSNLQTLVLSGVIIGYATQSIEVIAQTQTLRSVALRNCRMVSGWYELAHLRLLETLDLSGCGLDLDLRALATCVTLRKLLIARNRPHGFHRLPQITTLDCSNCAMETFASLVGCTNLTVLDISGNQPLSTEAITVCLSGMSRLRRLAVENCGRVSVSLLCQAIRDAAPSSGTIVRSDGSSASGHIPTIEYLSLGLHELDGLDDPHASIGALRSLTHLNLLGKHSNIRTLKFVRQLWSAPSLVRLSIVDADLAQSGLHPPSIWAAVPSIKTLDLVRCKIRSLAGLEHCVGAPLESLSLDGNYLSGNDEDPSLQSLLPLLERGLKALTLVNASIEDLDWLRLSTRLSASVRYPALKKLDLQENGHFVSGGDFISVFFPSLEILGLAPTFHFDLAKLAQGCPNLLQLHGIHPIANLGAVTPFPRVETASLHENALLHGVSLTFLFLRNLPALLPNLTTLGIHVHELVDGHVETASMMPLLRSLALFPKEHLRFSNFSLWRRFASLAQIAVVIPPKEEREAKDALYQQLIGQPTHVDGISQLEVEVANWVFRMPRLYPIEVVDRCTWW